ncbi:hypothetical protein ABRP29_04880 [Pseudomonas sp. WHRI 8822A]|uniref:hypothetical protein n=1 Tax=Pseudomonas sp. WHRI 8822A TaxID=3162568 RepID=UPI0032EF167F
MKKLLRADKQRNRLEFFRVPVRGERSIKWPGWLVLAARQGRNRFAGMDWASPPDPTVKESEAS